MRSLSNYLLSTPRRHMALFGLLITQPPASPSERRAGAGRNSAGPNSAAWRTSSHGRVASQWGEEPGSLPSLWTPTANTWAGHSHPLLRAGHEVPSRPVLQPCPAFYPLVLGRPAPVQTPPPYRRFPPSCPESSCPAQTPSHRLRFPSALLSARTAAGANFTSQTTCTPIS